MPSTACERNGHVARRPGSPFRSAFDFSALRTEHLCTPSFRQHVGTSPCARLTASAGRRGPAPKNKTSKAASMRRKVYSGNLIPGYILPQSSLCFHQPLGCLHKLLRSAFELFLVVERTKVVNLALIDRFRSSRRIKIHIAYGTDGMPIG